MTCQYKTELRRGNPKFCRAAYAVIVSHAGDGTRAHVETFYGTDGRAVRADAIRYAKRVGAMPLGANLPWPRNPYLPSNFPAFR